MRSLAAFKADFPEARVGLLHRGRESLEIDGVRCVPCEQFLLELDPARGRLPLGS